MVSDGERYNAGDSSTNGEERSGEFGSLTDLLERDRGNTHPLDISIVGERARKQIQRLRLHTITETADLGSFLASMGGFPQVMFPGGLHLPDGSEIGSAWIENHGTAATLTITEGPSGTGRIIAFCPFGKYRVVTFADNLSSFQITTSGADTGLVIVNLYSHQHGPKTGTL